ncbi:uncharacterized protein Dana_GF22461 [Drosophila ananassae]|uniref:Cytochrome b561 domain-containing protein n=1 Tax=Drosophila ananassae TaxID=7217 RepID=B3MWE3_DROAN|nr:uncharacterized protein LOC6505122 [Drosophila ananassae]EDV34928.1 uncharacterized protein Dana_GF22461 [Drosophila ananassae]
MGNQTEGDKIFVDEFVWPFLIPLMTTVSCTIALEVLAHILMSLVTIVVVRKCLRIHLIGTAEHAYYCTLGLFLCVGECLLMTNTWWMRRLFTHRGLLRTHMGLGMLCLWPGFIGILMKCINKVKQNAMEEEQYESHCTSKHSLCGLLGYFLLVGALGTGLSLVWYSEMALHLTHRLLGLSGFTTLACSLWFSFNTGFARREWSARMVICLKAGVMIGGFAACSSELWTLAGETFHSLPAAFIRAFDLADSEGRWGPIGKSVH